MKREPIPLHKKLEILRDNATMLSIKVMAYHDGKEDLPAALHAYGQVRRILAVIQRSLHGLARKRRKELVKKAMDNSSGERK